MTAFFMVLENIGFLKWLFEQISSHRYEKPVFFNTPLAFNLFISRRICAGF